MYHIFQILQCILIQHMSNSSHNNSFKALTRDSKWSYYTEARYEIVSLKIILKSLFKLIGVEFIINAKKIKKINLIRKFTESHLLFIIAGKTIEVILEVKKNL